MKQKIKNFIRNLILLLLTDKSFMEAIIPVLELISTSTKNNFDDALIKLLKNETENMTGVSLKSYRKKE